MARCGYKPRLISTIKVGFLNNYFRFSTTIIGLFPIWWYFFFDCSNILLWFCRSFPSNILNDSFDFTEMPSPRRWLGEPSPSPRRRLAKSMTSLRQLVEPSARRQPIQRRSSVSPQKRSVKCEAWGVKRCQRGENVKCESLTPDPSPKGEGSRMKAPSQPPWGRKNVKR